VKELLRRLKAYPVITWELAAASFFANILALASPLFVIQVLNRYVAHGVDATLWTLTFGVVCAIAFEAAFRHIRLKIAHALTQPFDRANADRVFVTLTAARADVLAQVSSAQKREAATAPDAVAQAYGASNLTAYLDAPFALLFLFALLLLSPPLAGVALVFVLGVVVFGLYNQRAQQAPAAEMQTAATRRQVLLDSALSESDTVRAFTAGALLRSRWTKTLNVVEGIAQRITVGQGGAQTATQAIQALMSTAVIAVGGMLVVSGQLDVGLLIGANILATRALGPLVRITQLAGTLAKANTAQGVIDQIGQIPLERKDGSALRNYKGSIEFKDFGFAYPGQPTPLFESLSLRLEPGSLFVIAGANGSGKTTLAKLMAGLLTPSRGQVLVDGVELSQIAPEWWRRQLVYLPQEPGFINATVRENIKAFNPDLDEEGFNQVIRDTGLETFFATSQQGFDMELVAGGRNLPLGIRRRLAMARALASQGRLVILDEPIEGLDAEGAQQMGRIINTLSQKGCTIIALSHDPNIIKGVPQILDLNAKPVPRLLQMQPGAGNVAEGA
jgi:ATP-binding cassette subfamily C protein LapB